MNKLAHTVAQMKDLKSKAVAYMADAELAGASQEEINAALQGKGQRVHED